MLCIGHSHVACVARAGLDAGLALHALNFWELPGGTVRGETGLRLSPELAARVASHEGTVYSLIGGAVHSVIGMLVHPRRFDFVLPDEPGLPLDDDAERIPALAVRRMLASAMTDYLSLMSHVRQLAPVALVHVEPPPPYEDAQRMHADIPWALYPGMRQEISPAALRYKLWRLHSRILQEWCEEVDAAFLPCPEQSLDERGFLREAYYGDGAHTNAAYGALVIKQMQQRP